MRSNRTKPEERCEYCEEPLSAGRVNVNRLRDGRHVLFQNVPALISGAWGHRIFDVSAVENMEHELDGGVADKCTAKLVIVSV